MRDHTQVVLPTDIEPLIESVYGGAAPAASAELAARLAQLDRESEAQERDEGDKARAIELAPPDAKDPFHDLARLFEDDRAPAPRRQQRARARSGGRRPRRAHADVCLDLRGSRVQVAARARVRRWVT